MQSGQKYINMMNLAQKIDAYHKSKKHTAIEKVVFENSIDCLVYGYGFSDVNIYNCDVNKAKNIFKEAVYFLANN